MDLTNDPPSSDAQALTTTTEPKKKKVIIRRKRRPARPQVDPATFKPATPPPTGTIFNIWYNKWSGGDREDSYLNQTAAQGRCVIARDSGYTKADSIPGSYFCLHFARGLCPRGVDCEYLHRLPTVTDIFPSNVDCFGRDKFSDYRDDMGGVGSFQRQNRTLYVGRIHVTDDIEEIVARHFQEWGQIERIRVLTARGVAFVTYMNEANSQFAKEAMDHQALDHSEILNVRWATVDPNPAAQKREARRLEEQAAEAIRKALPAAYVAEIEGRVPEQRKRRKVEGSFGPERVEGVGERLMIEGAQGGEGNEEEVEEEEEYTTPMPQQQQQAQQQENGNGILSSSTLAALRGFKATSAAPKAAPASGPLVGYGSDDDKCVSMDQASHSISTPSNPLPLSKSTVLTRQMLSSHLFLIVRNNFLRISKQPPGSHDLSLIRTPTSKSTNPSSARPPESVLGNLRLRQRPQRQQTRIHRPMAGIPEHCSRRRDWRNF
ncbi:uncharacterized protein EI97DRAFT_386122 [Westerdykella ornata]|uniref:Pre-mRNA-splicing factor CWC2 n=1 Tax=Westerdykella ornata TaxID=318751 RepID=A0A6A6J7B4_WESOR|nr:uncharacterized protein EI97DRAFT_386122 [Westerdykella ornata]KAF2272285.1 hypothetical protein EI97DRAFT_386122 [Westerdykella ornata]